MEINSMQPFEAIACCPAAKALQETEITHCRVDQEGIENRNRIQPIITGVVDDVVAGLRGCGNKIGEIPDFCGIVGKPQ